jgi:hypothetical protein
MCQPCECSQYIQIRQLSQVVSCEHQVSEIRNRLCESGLHARNAVARKKEGCYARGEGEVSQDLDIVVGEVDGIMRLQPGQSLPTYEIQGIQRMNSPRQRPSSQSLESYDLFKRQTNDRPDQSRCSLVPFWGEKKSPKHAVHSLV